MPDDDTLVRVRDLIEYLQQFDPDLPVELDKDGWVDDPTNTELRGVDLVRRSGVFSVVRQLGVQVALFINN